MKRKYKLIFNKTGIKPTYRHLFGIGIKRSIRRMLEDIKDAENYIEACEVVNEIELSFSSWLYSKKHADIIKKHENVKMSVILYSFLRAALRMGLGLFQGDIDKLKKMVDYIYLDITDRLEDHAES
tara:strand:+ start:668 stop:1045 length:378 start_codon:yes stop_codon:yes gene_type:complete